MKLRLKDNSIRIRLSVPEVDRLVKSHEISSQTRFPGNHALQTLIKVGELQHVEVNFLDGKLELRLPLTEIDGWHLTDQVGHQWEVDLGNHEKLLIVVEKDFQCLTERPGEDEAALYPNPKESHGS